MFPNVSICESFDNAIVGMVCCAMLCYSKAGIEFHTHSKPSLLFCELNEQPLIMALGR